MIIKICGMRDPENIRAVNELGVDLIGLVFDKTSPRFVPLVNSHAGIIPDRVEEKAKKSLSTSGAKFVGVFFDEMPQTVVTNVYNFNLDYVQLNGDESPVYIDNLRSTIDPDIHSGIKVIKAISISSKDDFARAEQYENHADLLLFDMQNQSKDDWELQFDWSVLEFYSGDLPFLLSGNIGPNDAEKIRTINHPKCVGIDLSAEFEKAPAMKDVDKLRQFIDKVKY